MAPHDVKSQKPIMLNFFYSYLATPCFGRQLCWRFWKPVLIFLVPFSGLYSCMKGLSLTAFYFQCQLSHEVTFSSLFSHTGLLRFFSDRIVRHFHNIVHINRFSKGRGTRMVILSSLSSLYNLQGFRPRELFWGSFI